MLQKCQSQFDLNFGIYNDQKPALLLICQQDEEKSTHKTLPKKSESFSRQQRWISLLVLVLQVHVQNATLAGGVAVGTAANFMIQPWGAILIGVLAAVLSVIGFSYLQVLVWQVWRYPRMHHCWKAQAYLIDNDVLIFGQEFWRKLALGKCCWYASFVWYHRIHIGNWKSCYFTWMHC